MQVSLKDRDIKEFEALSNLNPDFFRIQRTQAITGFNTASFLAQRPNPDFLLYSYAYVKWSFTTRKVRLPATDINFAAVDRIYKKPWGMSNAMTSIGVRYNGHLTTYQNPRYWAKYVHQVETPNEVMRKKFSPAGGQFLDYQGAFDTRGNFDGAQDRGLMESFNSAFADYGPSIGNSATATFSFLEPIMVGLHSPYELKHKLMPKSRYKRIGWSIPHIRQFGLEVKFEKIPANTLIPVYLIKDAAANQVELIDTPKVQALTGELVLTWINPSAGYKVPREVTLSSWYPEHFEFFLSDVIVNGVQVTINTNKSITVHQIPNAILIYATNIRDQRYNCNALNADDGAANQATGLDDGPIELNPSISNITLTSDINNVTVDTDFTDLDLYRITEKNANELPYCIDAWRGGPRIFAATPGNNFLYLTPEDLNIKLSTGVKKLNFNFQIRATFEAVEGYGFSSAQPFLGQNPQHAYQMHVVFFFDNYQFTLREDGYTTSGFLTNVL